MPRRNAPLAGCENVEQNSCCYERNDVAQVQTVERRGDGSHESGCLVHEGNRDEDGCRVGGEGGHAPWPRPLRTWFCTATPEHEKGYEDDRRPRSNPVFHKEEPGLVEGDAICPAPSGQRGGDRPTDEDGGPPFHRDIESEEGEPARIQVRGVGSQKVHDQQEEERGHEITTEGMGEDQDGIPKRAEGRGEQHTDRLNPDASDRHPKKGGEEDASTGRLRGEISREVRRVRSPAQGDRSRENRHESKSYNPAADGRVDGRARPLDCHNAHRREHADQDEGHGLLETMEEVVAEESDGDMDCRKNRDSDDKGDGEEQAQCEAAQDECDRTPARGGEPIQGCRDVRAPPSESASGLGDLWISGRRTHNTQETEWDGP